MTTPSQPASVDVTQLWCLHVLGPDDVFPAPDRATAQRWATQWTIWNQNRNPAPDDLEPVMSWIVALWPHDAESHAAGLAASVRGNTFRVGPPKAVRCCYGHTAFFAGCEDCPYVRWPASKGEPIPEYEADDISHLESLACYLDGYARDKRRDRLPATADLFELIARHLRTYDTTRLASLAPACVADRQATFGPCVHDWAYAPTTGGISCIRCQEGRPHSDPESVKMRQRYESCDRPAVSEQVGEGVPQIVLMARQYATASEDEVGSLPVGHLAAVIRDFSAAILEKA